MNHSFDIDTAVKHGVQEAIFINHFQFWILKNKANGVHCINERTWTYNSLSAFEKLFPYWSAKQIRRILDNLVESGVLVKDSFNKNPHDRTTWYAFMDESIFLSGQMNLPKRANGSAQTGKCITDTLPSALPLSGMAPQPVVASPPLAKKPLDERKAAFRETLVPHLEKYGKDMLNEFFKYWTEPNRSGTAFRYESEKFWDLSKRLATWHKNQKTDKGEYGAPSQSTGPIKSGGVTFNLT